MSNTCGKKRKQESLLKGQRSVGFKDCAGTLRDFKPGYNILPKATVTQGRDVVCNLGLKQEPAREGKQLQGSDPTARAEGNKQPLRHSSSVCNRAPGMDWGSWRNQVQNSDSETGYLGRVTVSCPA